MRKKFGHDFSLNNPVSFNEKINYRMVFQHDNEFSIFADKLAVRKYVSDKIGKKYLVPLLGVYHALTINDFDVLPESFVMKCNHDSGSFILCKNKASINKKEVIQHFRKRLKRNPYVTNREWQYKNIKPLILAEEYIDIYEGESMDTFPELFRLHCFHGDVKFIEVDFTDSIGDEYVNIYNKEWCLLPFTISFRNTPWLIKRPDKLNEMIDIAIKLSAKLDYCRIDLMLTRNSVFFSEITLTPESGQLDIFPREWDEIIGGFWSL